MPKTGEKAGTGKYQCTSCGQLITLDDDLDNLPTCPRCKGTNWWKLSH